MPSRVSLIAVVVLVLASGACVRGAGTGVVVGGPRSGEVIVGNVETEIDEFERAVAIRYHAR